MNKLSNQLTLGTVELSDIKSLSGKELTHSEKWSWAKLVNLCIVERLRSTWNYNPRPECFTGGRTGRIGRIVKLISYMFTSYRDIPSCPIRVNDYRTSRDIYGNLRKSFTIDYTNCPREYYTIDGRLDVTVSARPEYSMQIGKIMRYLAHKFPRLIGRHLKHVYVTKFVVEITVWLTPDIYCTIPVYEIPLGKSNTVYSLRQPNEDTRNDQENRYQRFRAGRKLQIRTGHYGS